ncbi:metallophosphoesterase [Algibacter sp. AS12]|uniref:metallophosphoesterase n=1 Tax=Algibacter sp. AS12 TaxID=3135773 RepID=UPI00398A5396
MKSILLKTNYQIKIKPIVYVFLLFVSAITFAQNSITLVNPPTTVTADTEVAITFNYTKNVARAHAYIRLKDASGNLTEVNQIVTDNSGTLTLNLPIPASALGSGYSYQAQIFNPDAGYAHLATENFPGVTVVAGEVPPNTIVMTSYPTTVQSGTFVDITFDYTKDVVRAHAFIRFKDVSGNLTDVNQIVTDNAGTLTLSLEIPSGLFPGSNYSYQAQIFNPDDGYAHLATQNITGITVESTPAPGERISVGDNWKYYDAGNEPTGNWKIAAFDDSSWASGNAELGYGEGDEATVISTGALTSYYRKSFTASTDDASLKYLDMSALRDDGMVVYINGAEVWRDNMPSGTINYNSFATSAATEGIWINNVIDNLLVDGINVVAVEIHQNGATSSDISFNFRLEVRDEVQAELTRGPYLQKGRPDAITVKYRTNTNTETIVNYGTSLGALNSTVSNTAVNSDHEIELTGLLPNTKYYYEIANNAGVFVSESSDMFFKTAPTTGTDQFVRAWILGDAGTGDLNQKNVRDEYYNYVANASTNPNQTDMMLFLGDNAYDSGLDNEYQIALFNIYKEQLKNTVAWSTLGNHDGYSADSNTQTGPYYDIFSFPTAGESGGIPSGTEAYYSFDYANIHFIVLESYTLDTNENQMAWCTQDIQNTDQDWIVAIFHHPPYSKGSHDSDFEAPLVNMRNNFLPILEANGVDLILSGHSHSYERSYFINGHYGFSDSFDISSHTVGSNGNLSGKADTADGAYQKTDTENPGAVYITTGSAGKISGGDLDHNAMYASLNELGSCVLEIEDDGVDGQNLVVKFINDNGSVSDYFAINKAGISLSTEHNAVNSLDTIAYPVPVKGLLNINVKPSESLKEVKIYNAVGKLVKSSTLSKINVNAMPAGMYVVHIITDKEEYYKNIVVE